MIIEHEDNPSWAVSSPPPQTAHRRLDVIDGKVIASHEYDRRSLKPSLGRLALFAMLILATLASGLASSLPTG